MVNCSTTSYVYTLTSTSSCVCVSFFRIYCATVRKTDDDEEELRFEAVQDQKTSVQRLVTQAANCDVDLTVSTDCL